VETPMPPVFGKKMGFSHALNAQSPDFFSDLVMFLLNRVGNGGFSEKQNN
jgi:hypothetical protein